jgi:hypothetical protein
MLGFISGFNFKVFGVLVAVLLSTAAWFYINHLRAENNCLQADVAQAIDAAIQNAAALVYEQKHTVAVVDALANERATLLARIDRLTETRKDINRAPQSDDGPVAPVLARTLDSLQNAQADDSGGEGGTPPRAGHLVDMPPNPKPQTRRKMIRPPSPNASLRATSLTCGMPPKSAGRRWRKLNVWSTP